MGTVLEHGCEKLHKSKRIMDLQSHGIANEVERIVSVLKKHLAHVAPELICIMSKIKNRRTIVRRRNCTT